MKAIIYEVLPDQSRQWHEWMHCLEHVYSKDIEQLLQKEGITQEGYIGFIINGKECVLAYELVPDGHTPEYSQDILSLQHKARKKQCLRKISYQLPSSVFGWSI